MAPERNDAGMIEPFVPLLRALATRGVRFVVVGSVAVALQGASDSPPGDLDIVADCAKENLVRLAGMLGQLEARAGPPEGAWRRDERGEWRWETREPSAEERAAWRWAPDPADCATFDGSFETSLGRLDIVPEIAGRYDELTPRADKIAVGNVVILVASIADLLAKLTVPRRAKDVERVRRLRAVQAERATPPPLSSPEEPVE